MTIKRHWTCGLSATAGILLCLATTSFCEEGGQTAPIPDNKLAATGGKNRAAVSRWQDAKFGLFMHWGVYSVYGGTYKGKDLWSAEWIQENARIPWDEYSKTAAKWNPLSIARPVTAR